MTFTHESGFPRIGDAESDAVLWEERATHSGMAVGIATLNSARTINALSLDMIRSLDAGLCRWAGDPRVACVILTGAGEKGFCAGGDVRQVRESVLAYHGPAPNPQAQAFFSEEYRLDYHLHTYPKPLLVWGDGVVMGGGLGLMAGASHRVVTERSRIAMPEVSIGFYPDVGASWFLRRMPGRLGLFLALTGAALNADDALAVGLADHALHAADREPLLERLTQLSWGAIAAQNHIVLSRALRSFAGPALDHLPSSNVGSQADAIQRLIRGDTLAEIHRQMADYHGADPWLQRAARTTLGGSPTSASLIWEIWQRAKHLSLAEALRMELIVSLQCCSHPDFAEGVRALLVDKDNSPRWTPATLDEVPAPWIAGHFVAPWPVASNGVHPLSDL